MLVECSNCGAPLSLAANERFTKCAYCDYTNKVRSLKTLAVTTPAGWKPPERWRPPNASQAPSANVLVYRGPPPPAVVPQVQARKSAGCIVLVAVLLALGGAVVPFLAMMPSSITSVISRADTIDLTRSPLHGFVLMDPGQPPVQRSGSVAPSIQASRVASGCRGYVAVGPAVAIRLSQPRHVRIVARSTDDLTLLARDANGTYYCDDDSAEGRNPMISSVMPAGDTRVWVGAFGRNTAFYQLSIDSPDAAGAGVPGVPGAPGASTIDPTATAQLGTLDLDAQPAGTVRGVVQGLIDAHALGPSCRGYTSQAPHLRVVSSRPRDVRFTTTGDGDLTLIVRSDDGTIRCDDDSGGRRQPALEGPLARGAYQVWVGVYSQTEPPAFQLRVETTQAPSPRRTRRSR